ncbi:MAG: HAMP domain-containing histidine kinase [Novosphingobium sp.]|nr:HAMP domain-containing histidine kinase [Novosphingobium sp.]
MHFDDRLDTVLRQPVRGREIARVQYVQLLDLLGKTEAGQAGSALDPAYERLSALTAELTAPDREKLLRGSGIKLRNPALVAFLAEDDTAIASAAIAAAELEEQQWLDLVPALPVAARGVLRHRRDLGPAVEMRLERLGIVDRGLPPTEVDEAGTGAAEVEEIRIDEVGIEEIEVDAADVTAPDAPQPKPERESSIGELVRRIETYRKSHPTAAVFNTSDAPRLPLGDTDHMSPQLVQRFDFVTDAMGRIVRADPDCAPMVVGTSLGTLDVRRVAGSAPLPKDALRLRQPIEGQVIVLEGAPSIGGNWRIDAAPLFDAATGRYTGHAGRAHRLCIDGASGSKASEMADRMRQVLHELRNPAGAIQMASEFIQQQAGGPVTHEYRALAATIASDTATVLGGLDELDRLVKFDAGVTGLEPGEADLAACVAETAGLLEDTMAQRQSGFAADLPGTVLPVAVAKTDLERLVWRLLAVLASATGPDEKLAITLTDHAGTSRLAIDLPAALRPLGDEELFAAQANERGPALSAGMFGLGFTLRLAAAEARSAGGALRRDGGHLILELPIRTAPSANISSR